MIVDGEATGTIENHDPMPRALLARFGRTAAVHVVEHIEERLTAPRTPGIEGRFAGQQLRPGMQRDAALGLLSRLGGFSLGGGVHGPVSGMPGSGGPSFGMAGRGGARMGMPGTFGTPGLGGAGMGMASPAGAMTMGATATGRMPGAGMGSMGTGAMPGAGLGSGMRPGATGAGMGMASGPGAMQAGAGPGGMPHGGGLFDTAFGGGDLLTGSSFAMSRDTRGGILSFWSRGAQSSFQGREGALAVNGDVRTAIFGADYAKGRMVAGLSLARSTSLGGYQAEAAGRVGSSVTGLYPWLGYKLTDRVTVWGTAGYGAGGLLLTPGEGTPLESALSMRMTAGGTRGDLIAGGAGGFSLAFKADALWVGTSIDGTDGPGGRLAATAAAVTRLRTGLEGSRDYRLGRVLSLKPVVEVGVRHDGGDAENGAGMDVGGGVVVTAPGAGLSVDVRVRMLVVHQAEDFRERGVSVSLSYDPQPSTPLGFMAKLTPSWGGQASGGAEALWGRETLGMAGGGFAAAGNRLDGEVGYGLPLGSRLVGTPRMGLSASQHGREYRLGYGMKLREREANAPGFEVGVDAQRRESPQMGGASNGLLGRATLGW